MKLKDIMPVAQPPLEPKTYMAVIVGVYEIGKHYNEKWKNYSYKLIFEFDIPSKKDADGNPRQISKWLTPGRKKGCEFLTFFGGLDDCDYDANDIGDIDPAEYLGRPCQIRVVVNKETQKNGIDGVMTFPDGVQPLQTNTPRRYYSVSEHGFSGEQWENLPEWVREFAKKSEEYQQNPPDQPLDMPPVGTVQNTPDTKEGACPI